MSQTANARRAALAKIHIGKAQLIAAGTLDESGYRRLLLAYGETDFGPGAITSADLNERGITKVLLAMQRLGATFTRPERAGRAVHVTADRQPLLKKVEALLAEAKRPMKYADGLAKRMYKIDAVTFADARQLRGIIAALTQDARRHNRTTGRKARS